MGEDPGGPFANGGHTSALVTQPARNAGASCPSPETLRASADNPSGRMSDVEPLQLTLRRAKETKNTVRCEEPESDRPTVVGALYLQKWAVHRLDDPETITVNIERTDP